MTDVDPSTLASGPASGPALGHLEALTKDDLRRWLGRALRGQEPLPRLTIDEAPDITVARHESDLGSLVRKDLRTASMELMIRFIDEAGRATEDDDYVRALLGVVQRLGVDDAVVSLGMLAQGERFDAIRVEQQAAVLGALLDLRAPLDRSFWHRVAGRGRHLALAFTGLLRLGMDGVDVLPQISGDEIVADSLYVVLSQHARHLRPEDRNRLVGRVREVSGRCVAAIGAMLDEWLAEQEGRAPGVSAPTNEGLDEALEAFFAERHQPYERKPESAKLLPDVVAA
ncbi:MAG: hypothetical protein AAGF11_03735 [Myxococcota bacterium]